MTNTTWRIIALACALGFTHDNLTAQTAVEIAPGSPHVRGDQLATGSWRVQYARILDGKEKLLKPYHWDLARITWNGRPALVSVQWSEAPDAGADSTVVDPVTLATLAFRAHNRDATESADYTGTSVHFIRDAKTGRLEKETRLETSAFAGSVQDLVIGALPLALDYSARLPFVEFDRKDASAKIEFVDVRVIGEDIRGTAVVWVVNVTGPNRTSTVEVDQITRAITAGSATMGGWDVRMTRVPTGR